MNLLDVIILIILLADIVRGSRIGFSRQFFSFIGFWGGLFVAALVAPAASRLVSGAAAKLLLVIAVVLLIATALSTLGDYLSVGMAKWVRRLKIGPLDAGLGAIFGAILVGLSVWILTAMVVSLPEPGLAQLVQQSRIVRFVDGVLPPAPPLIARIQRLIDPDGFPQVFIGPEPSSGSASSVASSTEVNAAVAADGASTVKIEGFGCGEEISGSGFVIAPNEVVTNAHVVAGVAHPLIIDRDGVHQTTVVWFDPNLDLAVLRTTGLDEPALPIDTASAGYGTHNVALGYPGGGPFTATPGAILQTYYATGRNIYDEGITARQVYIIEAVVQPGNSGGPLVLPNGQVIGIVFARSAVNPNVGYALTATAISGELRQAEATTSAVSTGACAND
jgi:S1-C subfamily serine protease